jgi:uncharacterized protein
MNCLKQVQWTAAIAGAIFVLSANLARSETCQGERLVVPDTSALAETRSRAESGDAYAQAQMGAAYLYGGPVRRDTVEALSWLQKSAAGGSIEGQYLLGKHYAHNAKSDEDYLAGARWSKKAADRGCDQSLLYLGVLSLGGTAVPKNAEEGFRLVFRAAEAGHSAAQLLVGLLLIDGEGTSKDPKAGFEWVRRAADAGNSGAAIVLATLYLEGTGTTKDPEKTRAILNAVYARADEQASTAAWYLGWMHMEGKGIPVDNVRAFRWMVLGAKAKVNDSEERLNTLIRRLPKQTLSTACSVLVTPNYSDNGVQQNVSANAGEVVVAVSSRENDVEVFLLDRSILGWAPSTCLK